ncbi:MAG TPA: hypothetical protein VHO72_13225 [Bacteroidales bacterium]|nr:hypothetical protein [Bacteroidales bacterium]
MVYNPYKESVKISSIRLARNENSPFILNVNGLSGKQIGDIIIRPEDSLYVFIQSYLPENGIDAPLLIKDSIVFEMNQTAQNVKVIAYAQDVHVFNNASIKTQAWSGMKPYLIMGTLTVDSLETLTVTEGVVVYMHRGANILVNGQMNVTGTFDKPVTFSSDRLEEDYKDVPGQWGGIYIQPGNTSHKFIWSVIKNGTTGLQIGSPERLNDLMPSLELKNTIIQSMAYGCLLAYHAKIDAGNCLIANAKTYTCYLSAGGQYQFYHTTFANYYSVYDSRDFYNPTLYLSNYENDNTGVLKVFDLTSTFFRNSIIYGTSANEVELKSKQDKTFDILFENCLIRKAQDNSAYFKSITWNKDPKFKDYEKLNFELDTLSNAKDIADPSWAGYFPRDLKNRPRLSDGKPDLGAYERIESK